MIRLLDLGRLSIEVKPSDSRAKAYIEQYGNRCWEADVMSADVIRTALNRELVKMGFDAKKWKQIPAEIERARKLL